MGETIFSEDFDKKQLILTRDFQAPVDLVWQAWTGPGFLDKWWAPEPYKSVTKSMDFREGGHRLYCMEGPKGEQHWAKMTYLKISTHKSFEARDEFSDENGTPNSNLPGSHWLLRFVEIEEGTRIESYTTYESVEAMKQILKMGIKEGITLTFKQLDGVLGKIKMDNKT